MTDELKQWEYDKGYDKGKADMLKVIGDIKADIKEQGDFAIDCNGESDLGIALKIIDNYIGEVNE